MVTRVEPTQVICFPTLYHFLLLFSFYFPFLITSRITSRRYLHVTPPRSTLLSTTPGHGCHAVRILQSLSSVLRSTSSASASLLLVPPLATLPLQSRSIIFRNSRGEKKKQDVWSEVRSGEVKSAWREYNWLCKEDMWAADGVALCLQCHWEAPLSCTPQLGPYICVSIYH